MQVIRTCKDAICTYRPEGRATKRKTLFAELTLSLNLRFKTMLIALEQGCGQERAVVQKLSTQITQKIQAFKSSKFFDGDANSVLQPTVIVCADEYCSAILPLLRKIVCALMNNVLESGISLVCEPGWWLWCGSHGPAKWMAWDLYPESCRATMLCSAYKYPWCS